MLERLIQDQIFDFILENNTITKNQLVFRKLYSTVTSLIRSTDHWYENIDKKNLNLTIFLDRKKAFDTVDHKILLDKLSRYGMKDTTGSWFQSNLAHEVTEIKGKRVNVLYTSRFLFRTSTVYHIS